MRDNSNYDNTQQNEEQQASQSERTFTQDEVEEIVKRRLARDRKKRAESIDQTEANEQTESKVDRGETLDERELKVMAKEKLLKMGLPTKLADTLKYSDEESLDEAIETIRSLNQGASKAWGQRVGNGKGPGGDPVRTAMGLDRK